MMLLPEGTFQLEKIPVRAELEGTICQNSTSPIQFVQRRINQDDPFDLGKGFFYWLINFRTLITLFDLASTTYPPYKISFATKNSEQQKIPKRNGEIFF